MKILKLIAIVTTTAFFFISCQKELTFNSDGISVGTLKKSPTGDCTPAIVNGIFKVDSVLNNTNYVDVQVDVTIAGTFDVKSDTINGYSFHKSGSVPTGLNVIRLYASGKPLAAGVNTFTIQYGTSTCSFSITVAGNGTPAAVFTLGGAPGNCTIASLNGTYVAGQAMTATNSIQLSVNVTTPGTYSITTTTVNAVVFTASGIFTTTGVQNVLLGASGTPTAAGGFNYPVSNGAPSCNFLITYTATISAAAYTLGGSPGNCTGVILAGTYTAGTVLTVANTAQLTVIVTAPGTYSISTTTVNGVSFAVTGTFTVAGTQNVILVGSGTPVNSGTFTFPATGNVSTCSFTVTFAATTPPSNTDYIPQTLNSNWSDRLVGGTPGDTTYTYVTPNTSIRSGQTYIDFLSIANFTPVDSTLHRKSAGKYYEYIYGNYGGLLDFPVNAEIMLLDSTLALNGTWTNNLPPNAISGTPVNIKINAQIIAKAATTTVAGNSYSNVIKVKFTYLLDFGTGYIVYGEEEYWYAKGLGMIYDKQNDVPVTTTIEYETTRIQIF